MENKIAVISDIHANYKNLRRALHIVEKERVDTVFCCGDIVGYGEEANDCCKLLRDIGCRTVTGNHDYAALGLVNPTHTFSTEALGSIHRTKESLTTDNVEWLADCPLIIKEGEMLFAHASPYLPELWQYLTLDEKEASAQAYQDVRDTFRHWSGGICFVGHTHIPVMFLKVAEDNVQSVRPDRYPYTLQTSAIVDVGTVGWPRLLGNEGSCVIYNRAEREILYKTISGW